MQDVSLIKRQPGFGPVTHRRITMKNERFSPRGLDLSRRQSGTGLKNILDDRISGQ
jgi:hypothetical protein